MTTTRMRMLSAWVAPLLDVAVLIVFVLAGRGSHDEGESVAGFLRVLWPFAAGLAVSATLAGAWRVPLEWRRAVGAWLGTVVLGMALRIGVQGRDFRPSFVVVTTVFLGVGLLGWRAVARRVTR